MFAASSSALSSRVRHLTHIVPAIPLAESLMMQTMRDPRDLAHAAASVLVITLVAKLFMSHSAKTTEAAPTHH